MSNEGLGRRQAAQYAVGVGARQEIPVDAHVGSPSDFLCRLQQAARAAHDSLQTREAYLARVFDWATDTRNLFVAWKLLEAGDGQAPGADGLRYSDVPPNDLWRVLRGFSQAVRDGSYEPAPLRKVEIPKGPSRGMRTLELPSILDRTLGKAVVQHTHPQNGC